MFAPLNVSSSLHFVDTSNYQGDSDGEDDKDVQRAPRNLLVTKQLCYYEYFYTQGLKRELFRSQCYSLYC